MLEHVVTVAGEVIYKEAKTERSRSSAEDTIIPYWNRGKVNPAIRVVVVDAERPGTRRVPVFSKEMRC